MLRLAVNLLLACVLCLNGFFAPVAMAHHGGMPAATEQASEGSCHESDAGDIADHQAAAVEHDGKHDASCCKHGQCLCGCILAANVPVDLLSASYAADTRTALPVALHVATVRYAVALRPPIA